jgi:antirestriction protein ArdC
MQKSIYDNVTQRIIDELEKGAAPWIKPWNAGASEDQNIISKQPYQGINRLILGMSGYTTPLWASYKQWQQLGANVKEGEKGTMIVFYSPIVKTTIRDNDPNPEKDVYHCLKTYYVFNAAQVEGIEFESVKPSLENFNPVPALEDRIQKTGALIKHGDSRAYYRPSEDFIGMPDKNTFKSESHYYATVLHELTHWSGAKHRLDRTKGARFADAAYAFEELVAEMGAAFLCQDYKIEGDLRHADYIGSWLKCLRADNKAIFNAAALAQKAANYINELDAISNQAAA